MNTTHINPFVFDDGQYNYTSMAGYALFIISEVMPFIRKKDQNNSFTHILVCLLRNSKCMIDKTLKIVEKNNEETPRNVIELSV